jgi:tetratricopeptide (TPR) repeat protein
VKRGNYIGLFWRIHLQWHRVWTILILAGGIFIFSMPRMSAPAPVSRNTLASIAEKLEAWNVEESWREAKALLDQAPADPNLLELSSRIAFHRGDYAEAARLMKAAIVYGGEDEKRKGFALFVEQTIGAVGPMKQYESPHFTIRLDERRDGILSEYVIDGLERTYQVMTEQYGFRPEEKVRIEIFPDTKAFYYASTLSARDIEVTGAVGIAQFNKLMVLSPRALVYGYRWLDAISHEYMHYLIMKVTSNRAPIWFHEGLAKYEETHWRSGPSYLSPLYETLLARAVAEGRLIAFERMEPSLIKLDTPEDVQLAYAQAASAIEYILSTSGYRGLRDIMRTMASSQAKGAGEAIQVVLGIPFPEFEKAWREHLSSRPLKVIGDAKVRRYKIKEGEADEERLDLAEIRSMVARNKAHLGDLLKERGRMEAAVREYRRALSDSGESVPIMNRLSDALIAMGQNGEALQLLKRARDLSPDHPTTYTTLGQTYLKVHDFTEASAAFRESIQINPFNPEVHQGLATALEQLGDPAAALKEREIARRLES